MWGHFQRRLACEFVWAREVRPLFNVYGNHPEIWACRENKCRNWVSPLLPILRASILRLFLPWTSSYRFQDCDLSLGPQSFGLTLSCISLPGSEVWRLGLSHTTTPQGLQHADNLWWDLASAKLCEPIPSYALSYIYVHILLVLSLWRTLTNTLIDRNRALFIVSFWKKNLYFYHNRN